MKQVAAYGGLGVAAYLVFLVGTFPAERAVGLMAGQLQGVGLHNVSGTAMSGQLARLTVADQSFSRVKWELSPLPLLWGKVAIEFEFSGEGREGSGQLGLHSDGSLSLDDLSLRLPIADIDQHFGLGPVKLGGMIQAELEHVAVLDKRITAADGTVSWREAHASGFGNTQLGNFVAVFSSTDDSISATLNDDGGPLQLEGILTLNGAGQYQLDAKAAVRDASNRVLSDSLSMLGRPGGDGRVPIKFSGTL